MADEPQPAASQAQPQTIITRALGPVAGAAGKGSAALANVIVVMNYLFACHDAHKLLHPDDSTEAVIGLGIIMLWDEIRVTIQRAFQQKKRRATDSTASQGAT